MRLEVEHRVDGSPERAFAFLADLRNHWALCRPFLDVTALTPASSSPRRSQGARVVLRGPLGVRRTAITQLETLVPPTQVRGSAEVGNGTRASISWLLRPDGHRTVVTLRAGVERATAGDRLLLWAGGAWWMRRRLRDAVEQLGRELAAGEQHPQARHNTSTGQ